MKKYFTMLAAALLLGVNAMAQTVYGLKINGINVTSDNASAITGDGIIGSISYDADNHVLTLDNATVNATTAGCAIDDKSESGLTVKLVGENTLTSTFASTVSFQKAMTITGAGKLSVSSSGSTGLQTLGGDLTISGGCEVSAAGIGGISGWLGTEKLTVNASTVKASGFVFGAISDFDVQLIDCEIKSGSLEGEEVYIAPTATSIRSARRADAVDAPAYGLNGVRLDKVPAKGLYIQNGKKVMGK